MIPKKYASTLIEGLSVVGDKFVYNGVIQGLVPQSIAISETIYSKPTEYNESKQPVGQNVGFRLEQIENIYVVGNGGSPTHNADTD